MSSQDENQSTAVTVITLQESGVSAREDFVATEEPLEIQISHVRRGLRCIKNISVTMRTPGHDEDLAVGFLFSEGVIEQRSQIESIITGGITDNPNSIGENRVRVVLRDDVQLHLETLERHFYTTSSCGVCGKTSLEALAMKREISLNASSPLVSAEVVQTLPSTLRATQQIFDQTGGLHAAALFDEKGKLLNVREDVGRHNAVDKLIGNAVCSGGIDFTKNLLFVSGRASFELMQKAVMARIPILAAVGAPSSLAVDLARQYGATLLGFVRDGRFNIYSGAHRIREVATV